MDWRGQKSTGHNEEDRGQNTTDLDIRYRGKNNTYDRHGDAYFYRTKLTK
jgi:hypothetical protein